MSSEKQIKVTDRRMFTPDGELREEYRTLMEKSTAAPEPAAARPEPAPPPPPPPSKEKGKAKAAARPEPELAVPGFPEAGPEDGPSFYDLVAMMAEPVPIYLGDVGLPDGRSAENLEMARLHIDLLDVVREKTAGNLTAQESAFLEDLLYRMRVRYVQKTR